MCSIIEIKNNSDFVIKYDTEDSIGSIEINFHFLMVRKYYV